MYHKLVDMHVHTDNSPDGNHSSMFICEKAELMGVRALAFTDHCEIDTYYKENYDKRVIQSYFEISKAQSAFRGKVLVLKGIELAQGLVLNYLSAVNNSLSLLHLTALCCNKGNLTAQFVITAHAVIFQV